MEIEKKIRCHYCDVLDHLKTFFSSPVSDPIIEGYFVHIIARFLDQMDSLKSTISSITAFIAVAVYNSYGPVTLFRAYLPGVDAAKALHRELNDPDYRSQLLEHNQYNRQLFDLIYQRVIQGEGVLLSWMLAYRYANYPEAPPIASIKSFIMSPWTDLKAIDSAVNRVMEAREQKTSP